MPMGSVTALEYLEEGGRRLQSQIEVLNFALWSDLNNRPGEGRPRTEVLNAFFDSATELAGRYKIEAIKLRHDGRQKHRP
ncbi:hypothetical protein LSAT2_003538 [Lamellibrachia satsuma]|nr:hypothetical protein LSAT2_003538 [Lamellibrachia satsuma]